jgi:hypothetical protein
MADETHVNELMELAGFDAGDRREAAPYLLASDDPEALMDVLMSFGMKPYHMWRVARVLTDVSDDTGAPRRTVAQELLMVGPFATLCGIDLESVATSISVLFKGGARSPGVVLRRTFVETYDRPTFDENGVNTTYFMPGTEYVKHGGALKIRRHGQVQAVSWEATVLPALRRAMDAHPELRGASLKLETNDPSALAFEVKIHGEGWDRTGTICRGPLVVGIEEDCIALAQQAAIEASKARARPRPMACPACDGDLPSTCRKCGRTSDAAEIRHASQPCAAFSNPSDERRAAPDGYRFARSGSGAILVSCDGFSRYYHTEKNDPPEYQNSNAEIWPSQHEAARQHAARMLGHEPPPIRPETIAPDDPRRQPPEGYTFEIDADGDVWVDRDPHDPFAFSAHYWVPKTEPRRAKNASRERWDGHEEARQWAAHLVGEVAPPLREEGAAS